MSLRIVVPGGAGFIGSHLCEALLSRGYQVVVLDNLSTGSLKNIAHLLNQSAFRFLRGDVRDWETVQTACAGADVIVHLAAFKIPRYGNALETLEVNQRGGHNVLEAARLSRAKVILASTSDVYGKNPAVPFHEDADLVLGPSNVQRWSYAVSKLFDEHLCFAYREACGLPIVILRFFGSYGPRHHLSWWGGPQSVFIESILDQRELDIHGDGLQTRSFCYVSDTVAGIVAALESERAVGEIINIGSIEEISILDLAHLIQRLAGVPGKPRLRFVPYTSFAGGKYEDVRRRVPDISKARELLGFAPEVSLQEGLARTIAWHRGLRSAKSDGER